MGVRPLGDRVLVKKNVRESVRKSGLVIPDSIREQSDRGEVLDIGPGAAGMQPDGVTPCVIPIVGVEIGDTVVFSPYAGSQVIVGDDEFLLLRIHDVLGVLDAETASA